MKRTLSQAHLTELQSGSNQGKSVDHVFLEHEGRRLGRCVSETVCVCLGMKEPRKEGILALLSNVIEGGTTTPFLARPAFDHSRQE